MRARRVLEQIRDELHAVGREMRGQREEMYAQRQEMREQREEIRDILRFNGEVIRRSELAFGGMAGALRELRETLHEMQETQLGLREDSRAHTRAIFALIDRLEGGGAAPAT